MDRREVGAKFMKLRAAEYELQKIKAELLKADNQIMIKNREIGELKRQVKHWEFFYTYFFFLFRYNYVDENLFLLFALLFFNKSCLSGSKQAEI